MDFAWTFGVLCVLSSGDLHLVRYGRRTTAAVAVVAATLAAVAAATPRHHSRPDSRPAPQPARAADPSAVVAPRRARPPEARAPTVPIRHVGLGHVIGTLRIPRLHETETFRQGVAADVLQFGPGHYPETHLPGEAGTIAIAGHRTTHTHPFLHLNDLRANDRIFITAHGRRFVYRVYAMKIVRPTDVWVLMLRSRVPRLVLTACHPPHSAAFRIVVFARQIGPSNGALVARHGIARSGTA